MPFNPAKFTRNAIIIAGGVTLTTIFFVKGIVPHVQPKNFGVIEPGQVLRSGELTPAAMARVARDEELNLIVDLGAHEPETVEEHRDARTAEALGVRRIVLPLFGDGTGDPNRYVEALTLLREEDGPVLIHCAAGAQRTGVAVALYRMIEQGWTMEDALAEAEQYRYEAHDNPRLRPYLEKWHVAIADSLRTGVPIDYDGPTRPRPGVE